MREAEDAMDEKKVEKGHSKEIKEPLEVVLLKTEVLKEQDKINQDLVRNMEPLEIELLKIEVLKHEEIKW